MKPVHLMTKREAKRVLDRYAFMAYPISKTHWRRFWTALGVLGGREFAKKYRRAERRKFPNEVRWY